MYVCMCIHVKPYTCTCMYGIITIVGRRGREEGEGGGGGRRGRGDCLYMGQLIGCTTLQHV